MHLKKEIAKICKDCSESTQRTYYQNIKRIYKMAGHEDLPPTKSWLLGEKGKALIRDIQKLKPNISRHLLNAGATAVRIYGMERDHNWRSAMIEASNKYSAQRKKQLSSASEKENFPKSGIRALQKAASIQKQKIKSLLGKGTLTTVEAYDVQKYLILLLFSHYAFRNSPATFVMGTSATQNTLVKPKGKRKYTLTLRQYKTKKSYGDVKIELKQVVSNAIHKFYKQVSAIRKHKFLFANKTGGPLTKQGLSKLFLRLTKSILNLRIGSRLNRVIQATHHKKTIEKVQDLSKIMTHSSSTQKTYIRKDQ